MLILHAGCDDGQLWLWGETSAEPESLSPQRAGRSRKRGVQAAPGHPDHYPYDAGEKALTTALLDAGVALTPDQGGAERVIAWLPTANGTPVASSPLIAEPPDGSKDAVLSPWTVTALHLPMAHKIELLCACIGKQVLAPGVIIGNDLAFWAMAMRFAGALVARQQFLPGLIATEDDGIKGYDAYWKPIFAGPDADRLATLARFMPHVCRALSRAAVSPPELPALSVLSEVLGAMVDHLVWTSLASGPVTTTAPKRPRDKRPPAFDSVHDQWLHALRSPDGVMEGSAAELEQLARQVVEWQRPLSIVTATPFRLCFRLEEPEGDADAIGNGQASRDPWRVRYLLQAADDPSLLIPAKDAWHAKGRTASLLRRGGFSAREYLLSSLGQASGICPHIEASLKTAAPGGYDLDAIVQFNWTVALGGEPLSLAELEALARLKAPLVKIRGQWVQVSAEEIRTALAFWRKKGTEQATVRDIVHMELGAGGGLHAGGAAARPRHLQLRPAPPG